MDHNGSGPGSPRGEVGAVGSTEWALDRLTALASGLVLVSESDHPLRVVDLGEAPEAELPSLIRAAVSRADAGVQRVSLEAFFERATRAQPYHTDADRVIVERYRELVRFMTRDLSDARVYRVGEIEVDVYALGQSPQGEWLGVATKLIET